MRTLPRIIALCLMLVIIPATMHAQPAVTSDDDLMRSLYPPKAYEQKKRSMERLRNMTPQERKAYSERITRQNLNSMRSYRPKPAPVDPTEPFPLSNKELEEMERLKKQLEESQAQEGLPTELPATDIPYGEPAEGMAEPPVAYQDELYPELPEPEPLPYIPDGYR